MCLTGQQTLTLNMKIKPTYDAISGLKKKNQIQLQIDFFFLTTTGMADFYLIGL